MTAALSLPPLLAYPERIWPVPGMLDRAGAAVAAALFARAATGRAARLKPV